MTKPHFLLIGRSYCHLCDDMRGELLALLGDTAHTLDERDVDADADLLARYDELVPVLLTGAGDEICHYHLNLAKVAEYLGRFK
jgi:hypothetical protein